MEHRNLELECALSLSVNVINATAGKNGLSPCLLVFGVLPRLLTHSADYPEQRNRMKAIQIARKEMEKVIAKQILATALRSNVPKAADNETRIGSDVLLYKERPVNKWLGPYKVMAGDNKNLLLNINGRIAPASVDKVKVLRKTTSSNTGPTFSNSMDSVIDQAISGELFFVKLRHGLAKVEKQCNSLLPNGTIPPNEILVTEILKPGDERNNSEAFHHAKKAEIAGLVERNTWTIVDGNSIPRHANIIGARFANSIKNVGTQNEQTKARYVVQGHRDKMELFVVHNSPKLRQTSSKMIVACASLLNFRIFLIDITQAYLQSKDKLNRTVYLRPKPEVWQYLNVDAGSLLQLNKPLYGMCDSGDYWGATFTEHVRNDL